MFWSSSFALFTNILQQVEPLLILGHYLLILGHCCLYQLIQFNNDCLIKILFKLYWSWTWVSRAFWNPRSSSNVIPPPHLELNISSSSIYGNDFLLNSIVNRLSETVDDSVHDRHRLLHWLSSTLSPYF